VNPSQLSSGLPSLEKLHNAIQTGKCKFRTLPRGELDIRCEEYDWKIMNGEIQERHRKERSDKGKKRKRVEQDDEDEKSDVEEKVEDGRKMRMSGGKWRLVVSDTSDSEDSAPGSH